MRKKTIGGWFIDNELKIDDDVNKMKNTRDLQDDLSFSKPNILVNNLIHHLSTCAGTNKSITDGCNSNNDNGNAINYLYLNKSIGGRKNNMNNKMSGGCFTCAKGKKKIAMFTKTFIIIIPSLYKKYKRNDKISFDKYIKKIKDDNKYNKSIKKGGAESESKLVTNENIDYTNVSFLNLNKHKEYEFPDFDNQLQDLRSSII